MVLGPPLPIELPPLFFCLHCQHACSPGGNNNASALPRDCRRFAIPEKRKREVTYALPLAPYLLSPYGRLGFALPDRGWALGRLRWLASSPMWLDQRGYSCSSLFFSLAARSIASFSISSSIPGQFFAPNSGYQ